MVDESRCRAAWVGEGREHPRPCSRAGQVLVAPLACGICGSDLNLVSSQAAMPDLVPAIVLGHEFVGELLDYGPGTDRSIPIGTPVTSVPYLDTGDGPQLVGLSPAVTGGLAERLVLQEKRLLPVSGDIPLRYAAVAEPLAVGVHAVAAADLQPGDAVLGCTRNSRDRDGFGAPAHPDRGGRGVPATGHHHAGDRHHQGTLDPFRVRLPPRRVRQGVGLDRHRHGGCGAVRHGDLASGGGHGGLR
ncbi:alcohol dehydrogenase catalytic domain-containing protein [Mycolicibacterium septicum]|nr:alcohol dehydrogenase catalytic domain-containing protein [Mycolicibacterium septicum]